MKNRILLLFLCFCGFIGNAQTTSIAPRNYKNIIIPGYGGYGDYTRILILLHEAYNTTNISSNYAIGTITAIRGNEVSYNRLDIAQINTASSYQSTTAKVSSISSSEVLWKLKTCIFQGKKYLAVEVPYQDSNHNHGYQFTGWTVSTGENMFFVPYQVGANLVNQNVISNIQDFSSDMKEYNDVKDHYYLGNLGVGVTDTKGYKFAVGGSIVAESVKVQVKSAWPDYVFNNNYKLTSLDQVETFINKNSHLSEIPSSEAVTKNGIDLGEMNSKLLKKIEELTLYLIEQNKIQNIQQNKIKMLEKAVFKSLK